MYKCFGKRVLDILISLLGLITAIPIFVLVSILIKQDSAGPIFFRQKRMGRAGRAFYLIKFRSMAVDKEKEQEGFEPGEALRVTKMGKMLRKTKLDEIPQLINVLLGDMSLVGPRPEVERYRDFYNGKYADVLSVRPGLTDMASIKYRHEEEILAKSQDPERTYKEVVLADKLQIAADYINHSSFFGDVMIIMNTFKSIFQRSK